MFINVCECFQKISGIAAIGILKTCTPIAVLSEAPGRFSVPAAAMSRARNIRAVIFDVDGTLLDTEGLSTIAINKSVAHLTTQECDWSLKKKLLGRKTLGPEGWCRVCIDELDLRGKITEEELGAAWERNLKPLYADVKALPGVTALVEHLAASNIPMAIATSSSSTAMAEKRKPHQELFEKCAQIAVTGNDPELRRGKPFPDIFLLALARLNEKLQRDAADSFVPIQPEECMVFEDAESGVQAGVAANMFTVAIPQALFTEEERCKRFHQASLLLHSMADFDPSTAGLPPYSREI
eukprot:m.847673 g.847673  ORF g.847673 m.847673 type:complete len:296 (+) comp23486_c0_seq1:72-959(+)